MMVPPKDPISLAAAIAEVLSAPERAMAMGRLGREIVEERFSAHSMVRRMEEYYLRMLQSRGMRWPAGTPAMA